MFTRDDVLSFHEVLKKNSSILILLKPHPTYDQVAAALALLLALQNKKYSTQLICPEPMTVEFGNLVGVDQVLQSLGNRSLDISFDYMEEMVENVSYNVDHENKKFHLVIRPQKGHRPLDPSTVEYSHVGLDADVIFFIGIGEYSEIEELYSSEEQAFHQAHTIAINKYQTTFANTNLDGSGAMGFGDMIVQLCTHLGLELGSDAATNALAAVEFSSEGFRHYSVTADTFLLAANLMQQGARRIKSGGVAQPSAATTSLAQAFAKKAPEVPVTPTAGVVTQTPSVPQLQRMQVPSNYAPPAR